MTKFLINVVLSLLVIYMLIGLDFTIGTLYLK